VQVKASPLVEDPTLEQDSTTHPLPRAGSTGQLIASASTSVSASDSSDPDPDGLERSTEPTSDAIDPADAAPPGPPESYGQLVYPDPVAPADTLVMHAIAGYEVVSVYSKPDLEAAKLGYLRIGARLKVGPKIDGPGCKKGFHALPTGGYACASKGLVVKGDKAPYTSYAPPAPRMDQPLPYDYGYVRKWNAPMYWRVPNATEIAEAATRRAIRESERTGVPLPTSGGDTDTGGDTEGDEPEELAEPVKLPLSPATPWLEKGFFLSIASKQREKGRAYWRTARGGIVNTADVYGYKAKDFQGVPLTEEMHFPFGFVKKKSSVLYELTEKGALKRVKKLERREFVDLSEETEVKGRAYMMTPEGLLVRKDHLTMAEPQAVPKGLETWDRWIDVSLSAQLLVAYEGDKPVYATLVSSGRKGTAKESFETPKGRWRISSKHISTTMDGGTASDGNYSIQDVPWTMFFQGSYALHGAFWHRSFGRVRSHGCVNLGPSDARWLFNWTTPFLPSGWHGVNASDESPGTTVIIRD
jgi:hypothetical protein